MKTLLSLLYKVYLRLADTIHTAYVVKQVSNFTPPPNTWKSLYQCQKCEGREKCNVLSRSIFMG